MTDLDARLRGFISRPRYEVFPAKGTEQAVADWVPAGQACRAAGPSTSPTW